MKALPNSDPRSWEAQARIHNDFCPHGHLDFLPWHRKYIYYFEKLIMHFSGGKLNALPYWDYTTPAEAALPPAFVSSTYGAGTPNPLYHANRSPVYASGVTPIPDAFVNPSGANAQLTFSGFSSSLEGTPHDNVHVQLGGTMVTYFSPRDPIFWLHHCNIDRLWSNWLGLGGGRSNPVTAGWLNANYLNSSFVDEASVSHQLKNSDVLNTVTQLDYTYGFVLRPFRDYYLWRRLWWWELLRPIPIDIVVGPKILEVLRVPREEMALLKRIERIDPRTTNLVMEFRPVRGMSSAGTFDLVAQSGRSKPIRVKTFSLFVITHGQGREGGHMMGMEEDKMRRQLVLNTEETARLLPVLRSGSVRFTVQLAKGSANNAKIAQDPKILIELRSIGLMEAVRTRRPR